MTRGAILNLTPEQIVDRALSACVPPMDPDEVIWYCSTPGLNGGADPTAETCASVNPKSKVRSADCVGFLAWAAGFDRRQPVRCRTMEWVNQNSMIADAARPAGDGMFRRLLAPRLGCFAAIRDIPPTLTSKKRTGHVAIVTSLDPLYVTHCSPSNHRRVLQGIAQTTLAQAFLGRVKDVVWLERVT